MLSDGLMIDGRRPRIAICDYLVTRRTPIGSCHLALLAELCDEIDFVVFATEFENPRPDRIEYVHVPAVIRPLALLFLTYHLAVLPVFWWATRVKGRRFDLVQSTETYTVLGDLAYSHFCHGQYLKEHWQASQGRGLGRAFRWLDHALRASLERWVYGRVRSVVVPSAGLGRELEQLYALPPGRVEVIGNPLDLARFARRPDFDATAFRAQWGLGAQDTVAIFVALGHFERKGLPHVFAAMGELKRTGLKLLVLGGRETLIEEYRQRARDAEIEDAVVFAGLHDDVPPFFWCADFYLFPSQYETFGLATVQAAASGLPIITTVTNGSEEFLADGVNGFAITSSVEGVREGLRRYFALSGEERAVMSAAARHSVERFSSRNFGLHWGAFYGRFLSTGSGQRASGRGAGADGTGSGEV